MLAVFQNLCWNSNKTPLCINVLYSTVKNGVNFNVFNVPTLRFYHLESPLREAVKNCYFEDIVQIRETTTLPPFLFRTFGHFLPYPPTKQKLGHIIFNSPLKMLPWALALIKTKNGHLLDPLDVEQFRCKSPNYQILKIKFST